LTKKLVDRFQAMTKRQLKLLPFLKWVGGKRWLVANYEKYIPLEFDRYIEPFLGGGALFFYLQPDCAVLGDINKDLIETYESVRNNWKAVVQHLERHNKRHSEDYYYKIRANKPKLKYERAARFIYLNRTCWNGLYRVNLNGDFNVPIGTKTDVLYENDNFQQLSSVLKKATLHSTDFEDLIDLAGEGDLVFVDPPYTVRHNKNAFIKYNEKLFSWWDQERLFYAVKRAKRRGARIIGTNAFHNSVKSMYRGEFEIKRISRTSSISSKSESRARYDELLIIS